MSDKNLPSRPEGPNNFGPNQGPNMPDLYQWTGEGPCPGNRQGGPQGGPQGPDLYQYSGDQGYPVGPGQNGPQPPDLYQYSGDQQGYPNGPGSDRVPQGQEDPAIANWHPDYTYSSPNAQAWLKANEQTRDQALQVNPDGSYTVQFGDCLSTIAQRALQDQGVGHASGAQIKQEEQAIVKANDGKYSSLDYNPDYLKTGWRLNIPGEHQVMRPPQPGQYPEQPGVPPNERCVPRPYSNYPDFPPPPGYHARPSVIVNNYYVNGNVYVNEGGQGGYRQGPGQLSPQHRFQQNQGDQPQCYYPPGYMQHNMGYNPSMQYQWAPYQGNQGQEQTYGNPGPRYYNPRGYAGSQYYDQGYNPGYNQGYDQGPIQMIPNAVPGEGRAMLIPNAVPGQYQVEPISYDGQNQGPQTYPADYTMTNPEDPNSSYV